MTEQLLSKLIEYTRREWWIVLGTVIVAVALGFGLQTDAPDMYRADAEIGVNLVEVRRADGLPDPENLNFQTQQDSFTESLLKEVGATREEFDHIRSYTLGSPIHTFVVSVESGDEQLARRAAIRGAELAVGVAREAVAQEVVRLNENITAAENAKDVLDSASVDNGWQDADLASRSWEFSVKINEWRNSLAIYEGGYDYAGDVSVSVMGSGVARLEAAVGAGILGLLLGIVLGLVRFRWLSRSDG